jgi:diguanylate cyclase (GGDEF)-like protein/PAS domain S-box-containing protein
MPATGTHVRTTDSFGVGLVLSPPVLQADTEIQRICHELNQFLNTDWVMHWQINRDGAYLNAEFNAGQRRAAGVTVSIQNDGFIQNILKQQKPVGLEDISLSSSDLLNILMQCELTSLLMLPVVQAQNTSLFCLGSYAPRIFSSLELENTHRYLTAIQENVNHKKNTQALQLELSERRRVENQLRISKTRFFDFINSLEGIVFEGCLRDGVPQLTFVSQNTESILGYRFEHWFHEPALYVRPVHPDDRDRIREALTRTMNDHDIVFDEEYRLRRSDGSLIWVRTQARVDVEEDLYWRGLTTDITALKQQQLFERERNRILEMVAQSTDLFDVLQSIVHLLHQQFRLPCGIVQYEDSEMAFRSNAGLAKIMQPYLERIKFKGRALGVYLQLKTGQSYQSNIKANLLLSPELRQLLVYAELNHVNIVPLSVINSVAWGGIVFFSSDQKPIHEDPRILSICHLAAVAIEQHRLLRSLEHQAMHDQLTQLPNRSLFNKRLAETITHAKRYREKFALYNLDLNRFKEVNDTHGHSVGDSLLKAVAKALQEAVLATYTVARLGGDEFCIIAPDITSQQDAQILAMHIQNAVARVTLPEIPDFYPRVSVGLALYPTDGTSASQLYHVSDQTMYYNKTKSVKKSE